MGEVPLYSLNSLRGNSLLGGNSFLPNKSIPCTMHHAPCTLHPQPCDMLADAVLHPTPHALHPTPYTLSLTIATHPAKILAAASTEWNFIIGGYDFTFVKRLVLVQIIKLSPFKTQNIIIKQTWF